MLRNFAATYHSFHKPSLFAFLGVNIFLISLTIILGVLAMNNGSRAIHDFFNIGRDWSAAEIFGYLQWALMATIFFVARFKGGEVIFFWLGLALLFILSDDSLQIHEKMGWLGGALLGENNPLSSAIGEIVFFAFAGALLFGPLLLVWIQTSKQVKGKIWPLAFLFLGLVFFGVGVDFLHFLAPETSWIGGLLLIAEDGGEMIILSLMASYVIGVFGNFESQA